MSLFLEVKAFLNIKDKFIGESIFKDIKKYFKRDPYLTFKLPKILLCFFSNSNSDSFILFWRSLYLKK